MPSFHNGIARGLFFLRERDGTGIQIDHPIPFLEHRNMGMAKHQDIPALDLKKVGSEQIPMDEVATEAVYLQHARILQIEFEEGLIDTGIAIAADPDDFRGETIENFAGSHRIIIGRNPVSRAIIEIIS